MVKFPTPNTQECKLVQLYTVMTGNDILGDSMQLSADKRASSGTAQMKLRKRRGEMLEAQHGPREPQQIIRYETRDTEMPGETQEAEERRMLGERITEEAKEGVQEVSQEVLKGIPGKTREAEERRVRGERITAEAKEGVQEVSREVQEEVPGKGREARQPMRERWITAEAKEGVQEAPQDVQKGMPGETQEAEERRMRGERITAEALEVFEEVPWWGWSEGPPIQEERTTARQRKFRG